ncbi:MAG: hypothetical protein EOP55_00565 [Sphingobacteriales bacterium]|nr:MAG: hypothetical protein EOP55_00565 [Sphingobacteriales bacterium]
MNIKQTLFTLSFLITGLFACTQSKKTNTTETSTVADTSQASIKGCYIYTTNRDTFQLAVTAVDKMDVEGSLIYNFFEKDDSKGTFKGKFDGEILKGDYTFQSEGSTSVREVIFKKTQNGFVEGHGDVKETGQKVVFSKPAAITYANGIELTRTDNCLP